MMCFLGKRRQWAAASCASLLFLPLSALAAGAPGVAPASFFKWSPFLGPFHSLILHYPIGFLTIAFILELRQWWRPSDESSRIIRLVIWLSLVSGLLAAALGISRASGGGYDGRAVELHRWFGLAVPVATATTLWLQRKGGGSKGSSFAIWGYRSMLSFTLLLLVGAGHFGGNLTHGSKYLLQNAPAFLKNFLDAGESPLNVAGASTDLAVVRAHAVLEQKCVICHGPEKQSGKYRLDLEEPALKGGKSGEVAIKPGAPLSSQLVRRILLPVDDDDVMPPKGKELLTAEEKILLIDWIQSGAKFGSVAPPAPTGKP